MPRRAPFGLSIAAVGGLLFLHVPLALIVLYAFTTEEKNYQFILELNQALIKESQEKQILQQQVFTMQQQMEDFVRGLNLELANRPTGEASPSMNSLIPVARAIIVETGRRVDRRTK